MLRAAKFLESFDKLFVPEAQRILAGGEGGAVTTGNASHDNRVLEGRRTRLGLNLSLDPALLPERDQDFAAVPVVPLPLHHRLISNAPPAQKHCQMISLYFE